MKSYIDLLDDIVTNSEIIQNRTGINANTVIGKHFSHDMNTGFPLLTTKKVNLNTIAVELEGFIKGITDKRWYQSNKCYIWDEWCSPTIIHTKYNMGHMEQLQLLIDQQRKSPSMSPKMQPLLDSIIRLDVEMVTSDMVRKAIQLYEPDLGPVYGYQWRHYGKQYYVNESNGIYTYDAFDGVDQLAKLIDTMKLNPYDRRMVVSALNPLEMHNDTLALPPCHWAFEVHSNGIEFDLLWHQRSVDVFLGLPYNIASYALLMKLLEKETGLIARRLHGFLGNVHIYDNHMNQVHTQRQREPFELPKLILPDNVNIFDWEATQWELDNYQHHGFLKGDVAV